MELFTEEKYAVLDNLRYLLQNIMSDAEQTFNIPEFNPDLTKLELKEQPKFGGEQVIKNSLELLLLYLIREKSNEKSTTEFFLSKISPSTDLQDEIVRILNSKIYENFKLDDLCESLHYGKTFICTTFKKKTGVSVYQTYLKLKIDESKKLIRKGLTFSSIAEKLCFDSVAHFTETFKKITGMTPREYKNSIK
jgi:AraC-like DNA-binding protein